MMVKYIVNPDDSDTVTEFLGEVSLGNVTITGGSITNISEFSTTDTTISFPGTVDVGTTLTADQLAIGLADTMVINGVTIVSDIEINSDTQAIEEVHTHSNTAGNGPIRYYARSRGTTASPTVVQSGDTLGTLAAVGYDGTDYAIAARVDFTVGGTPGSNDMPGSILFKVSPDGSQTPATALTINSDKNIDVTNGLDITGTLTTTTVSCATTTVATDDKVLVLDTSATDGLRTVTTQAIADLVSAEIVSDIVGTMVTGNTETNITVTYQDADNTLDFEVPAAGDATAGVIETATQAEQETATSTTVAVTPGRQHFHPSAAKTWVKATASGTSSTSYNVTSITDGGTGDMTVVFDTDFSSTEYVITCCLQVAASANMVAHSTESASQHQFFANLSTTGAATDPNYYHIACFGDF